MNHKNWRNVSLYINENDHSVTESPIEQSVSEEINELYGNNGGAKYLKEEPLIIRKSLGSTLRLSCHTEGNILNVKFNRSSFLMPILI